MNKYIYIIIPTLFCSLIFKNVVAQKKSFDINTYLKAAEGNIYPNKQQVKMLEQVVPEETYQLAPSINKREYWTKIAKKKSGVKLLKEALLVIDKMPEIPISDEVYRRVNKTGDRTLYKLRYYDSMDRLEKYILGECIENKGRFIPQIETYIDSVLAMKSWTHPNHDKNNRSLEGKVVGLDLGARYFGEVLAMANVLLENKLSESTRANITEQLQWRIIQNYKQRSRGKKEKKGWLTSTTNWNAVCSSGAVFTTIVASENRNERITAIGSALNSMVRYISGFGNDGYCSEGISYWRFGFGHYLFLSEILYDYTKGEINLFEFNDIEKLKKIAHFPEKYQLKNGLYPPFSDGLSRPKEESDNFAYAMSAKYFGTRKEKEYKTIEGVQDLLGWSGLENYVTGNKKEFNLPGHTYFDDFGIVISRGNQKNPFSVAIKGGHNLENHNHNDVGSYSLLLGDEYIAGDIGAPVYVKNAFSPKFPARSSWGHPVPKIGNIVQSKGILFKGKIIETNFSKKSDRVVIDIKKAYKLPELKVLERTMENNKKGEGLISVKDEFLATKSLKFGTAITTFSTYKIIDNSTIMLTGVHHKAKVLVRIKSEGGSVNIVPEPIGVAQLKEGKDAVRIGVEFTEEIKKGSITITYSPLIKD